jgi:hypothetical protein
VKVFISWSGSLSKKVALLLKAWIEDVLQGTATWISADDIDKGSIWFGDITDELAITSVGILCLTPDNLTAPWVLFEAGSLSKGLSKSRVCPLLINLNHSDLTPPLSLFNGTFPVKDDMLKLIKTINGQNGDRALTDDRVEKAFEKWWDGFAEDYSKIVKEHKPAKEIHKRPQGEVLEEVLETVRAIQRSIQAPLAPNPVVIKATPGTGKSSAAKLYAKLLEPPNEPFATLTVQEIDKILEQLNEKKKTDEAGKEGS